MDGNDCPEHPGGSQSHDMEWFHFCIAEQNPSSATSTIRLTADGSVTVFLACYPVFRDRSLREVAPEAFRLSRSSFSTVLDGGPSRDAAYTGSVLTCQP